MNRIRQIFRTLIAWLGPTPALPTEAPVTHVLVSIIGAIIGIAGTWWLSVTILDESAALWLVASMGASAILLFGAPLAPLAQPWPLLGGHFVSAIIGVACATWLGYDALSAGMAVGLSTGAMLLLRCVHPPGGATALIAVIGGPAVAGLGWSYIWAPVLLNATLLLIVALVVNAPFAWRRYPAKDKPPHQSGRAGLNSGRHYAQRPSQGPDHDPS
ncbi:MAG: HPP family protein [Halothiobacillaceae bacterium]